MEKLSDDIEIFFSKKLRDFTKDINRHELGSVLGEEYTSAHRIRGEVCPQLARS